MALALVGLGSNVGDRRSLLSQAVQLLESTPGVSALQVSRWHTTQPVGGPAGQAEFLNGAASLETSLSAELLWQRLREIEQALGRRRQERWGPRTIDLDLLMYDGLVRCTAQLELPHPRMAFRRFVLEPAAEVAPAMVHPSIGWTIAELLQHLKTAAPYVAVAGSSFAATHMLAAAAAEKTGWQMLEAAEACDQSLPSGLASLTVARAIEFLHEQADLLSKQRWNIHARGAISSFWIENLLAVGDVLWPEVLDEHWKSLCELIVTSKLLVVYEPAQRELDLATALEANPIDAATVASNRAAVSVFEKIQAARFARAKRKGIGPVLWLQGCNLEAAQTEITAAIQSMGGN